MLSENHALIIYFINIKKFFIGYFPIDLIKDLFILLYFQEQCGRIYDSYISSIKDQNLLVSFFRELIY